MRFDLDVVQGKSKDYPKETFSILKRFFRNSDTARRYLREVARMCTRAAQSRDPREIATALALVGKGGPVMTAFNAASYFPAIAEKFRAADVGFQG